MSGKPSQWTDAQYLEYWKSRCTISETGCWVSWAAHVHSRNRPKTLPGYGQVSYRGKSYRQHRIVYMLFVGPIPDGHVVAHRCDNPPCFNPDHLFACTGKENMQDAGTKRRWPRQTRDRCPNGHPRTPENTSRQGKKQTLNCLLCKRERGKRKRERSIEERIDKLMRAPYPLTRYERRSLNKLLKWRTALTSSRSAHNQSSEPQS